MVTHSFTRMLGASSTYPRRGRYGINSSTSAPSTGQSNTFLVRPRLPLRSYARPKTTTNLSAGLDPASYGGRSKRIKSRKLNGYQKFDSTTGKKKAPDYTDFAYREAVSKLKYLLAESYTPRITPRKLLHGGGKYNSDSNPKINIESGEDTDDRGSMVSEVSALHAKSSGLIGNLPPRSSPYLARQKTAQLSKGYSNLALLSRDPQSAPPELMSFIERQEEYIEQLERESQYCRDELTNLLGKVREVVAENETLQDKSKNGFLKSVIEEYNNNSEDENQDPNDQLPSRMMSGVQETSKGKRVKLQKILEGPSIVFESRISELEAQLTQARVELRKVQEENQANLRRLTENGVGEGVSELKAQLERAVRDKRESDMKVEELQRNLSAVRDREADTAHKAKRTLDVLEQAQFEKTQAEAEMRRLKDELERQHERLREASQEASRRVAEERHQIERRYSQQVEQLSADVASHWDVASKSQLEAEKQRREMSELRRELAQKQALVDELKKELHSKISAIQSDLNQALAEKDAAEQEVSAEKLAAERAERQSRQEQSRLQTEINSYKQRLERADADLVHCRRENLRLSEQIASLEKELNLSKMVKAEEHRTPGVTPRGDNDKELTSMIMDIETKHAATVAGLEDALANQATVVSQLSVECQSLTQRLEANSIKHKEEMASLQNNLKYLTTRIQDSLSHQNENPISEPRRSPEVGSELDNRMSYESTEINREIGRALNTVSKEPSSSSSLPLDENSFVIDPSAKQESASEFDLKNSRRVENDPLEDQGHREKIVDRSVNESPMIYSNDNENREYIKDEQRNLSYDNYPGKAPITVQQTERTTDRNHDQTDSEQLAEKREELIAEEENAYDEHRAPEELGQNPDYGKIENYDTENQNYDPRYTDQAYEQGYELQSQYDEQGMYQGDDASQLQTEGHYQGQEDMYQNMQYNEYDGQNYEGGYENVPNAELDTGMSENVNDAPENSNYEESPVVPTDQTVH